MPSPSIPLVAFLLIGLATGCSDPPETPPSDPTEEADASPTDTASAEPGGDEIADVSIALDGEGIRTVVGATGSTRLLAFGDSLARVVRAVSLANGEPQERGTNPECGAGPLDVVTWSDGLTLYGSDGEFIGWYLGESNGPTATYSTMSGVGIGSARAEVESSYVLDVQETTLGTEFSAGELFGFLDGSGPDASVTGLWAGASCFFR